MSLQKIDFKRLLIISVFKVKGRTLVVSFSYQMKTNHRIALKVFPYPSVKVQKYFDTIYINIGCFLESKRRRLSPYVSRLTTSHIHIWENCDLWVSPNNECLLFLVVVIVRLLSNMSLHSLRNALQKYKKIFKLRTRKCKNC